MQLDARSRAGFIHRTDEKPWSDIDLFDLRRAIQQGDTIEEAAMPLGSQVDEVARKAQEMGISRQACSDAGLPLKTRNARLESA
jgi:hypothetical protein